MNSLSYTNPSAARSAKNSSPCCLSKLVGAAKHCGLLTRFTIIVPDVPFTASPLFGLRRYGIYVLDRTHPAAVVLGMKLCKFGAKKKNLRGVINPEVQAALKRAGARIGCRAHGC